MWSARAAALSIVLVTIWAFLLVPQGFVSGDSGAKLIQAVDLWNQRYSTRALAYDPRLTDGTERRLGDLFELDVGRKRIGIYSIVFVAAAAPFIAAFGMRGASVLPLLGAVLTILALRSLLRCLGVHDRLAALTIGFASLATPVLLYSGQLYEHTLTCGLVTAAIALVADESSVSNRATAGGLVALAATIRPEAYCAVSALALALALLGQRTNRRLREALPFAAAAFAVLASYWTFNVLTAGVWDPLVSSHHGQMPRPRDALRMLWGEVTLGHPWAWLALTAVFTLVALRRKRSLPLVAGVGVSALAVLALVTSSARILAGLLTVTPALFVGVASVPSRPPGRLVWVAAVAFVVQVLLFAHGTEGGGLQLGSRLLLPALPALLALAALAIQSTTAARWERILASALLLMSVVAHVRGMMQATSIARAGESAVHLAERAAGRVLIGRRHWEAGVLAPLLLKGRDILLTYPDDEGAVYDRLAVLGEHRCIVIDHERVAGVTPDGRSATTTDTVVVWPGWITLQLVEIR